MSIKKFVLVPFEKYQTLIKSNDIDFESNSDTQVGGSSNTVIDSIERLHKPPPPGIPATDQTKSDIEGSRIRSVGPVQSPWVKAWISL